MDEERLKAAVSEAVSEVLDDKLKGFWVEREKHWQHHQFIDELIQFTSRCKGTTIKAIVNCAVYGLIALLVLGFMFWGKTNLK